MITFNNRWFLLFKRNRLMPNRCVFVFRLASAVLCHLSTYSWMKTVRQNIFINSINATVYFNVCVRACVCACVRACVYTLLYVLCLPRSLGMLIDSTNVTWSESTCLTALTLWYEHFFIKPLQQVFLVQEKS